LKKKKTEKGVTSLNVSKTSGRTSDLPFNSGEKKNQTPGHPQKKRENKSVGKKSPVESQKQETSSRKR